MTGEGSMNCGNVRLLLIEYVLPSIRDPCANWYAVTRHLQGCKACQCQYRLVRPLILLFLGAGNAPASEADLLRRAAGGDRLAFGTLYVRHRQAVRDFVGVRYRSLDAHAVEDVVSEVFLRVWQDRQRLDSVDNYRPYLKSIARNVAADGFRRAARTPLQDLPPDLVCRWPEPHAVVAHEEFSRQVDHALAHLADSHRMAIQLAQEGLSSRQSTRSPAARARPASDGWKRRGRPFATPSHTVAPGA